MAITRNTVIRTSSLPNSRRPRWNEVSGCRSPSFMAIWPNSVREPVRTTTARAVPDRTTVPMKAQDGSSMGDSGEETGSCCFVAGRDSPVKTASSQVSSSQASRRRSAGTTSPTESSTTSPGTSCVTSMRPGAPPRTTVVRVADLLVQRLDGLLRPVLVEEAEPHGQRDDHHDDDGRRRLAGEARHQRGDHQQGQQGVADLVQQDPPAAGPVRPQGVGPGDLESPRGLGRIESGVRGAQRGQDVGGRLRGGGAQIQRLPGRRPVRPSPAPCEASAR